MGLSQQMENKRNISQDENGCKNVANVFHLKDIIESVALHQNSVLFCYFLMKMIKIIKIIKQSVS